MGEKTLNEYFYKPVLGASGGVEMGKFHDCLDVADAEIKANKDTKHIQGTDQKLDDGGANEVVVADVKDAVTKKHTNTLDHTQNTDTALATLTAGIPFPATQIPSANANTLDDYKEEEWTPALKFGGASVDMTYAVQAGLYTKIGRQVTVTGYILLSAKGTSTGNATITGLPFTAKNNDGAFSSVSLRLAKITFANVPMGQISKNTAIISMEEITEAGVISFLTDANFANDSVIILSTTYFTD